MAQIQRVSVNQLQLGTRILTTQPDGLYLDGSKVVGDGNVFLDGLGHLPPLDASNLFNLNASALSFGTVPLARLSIFVASGPSHAVGIVPDPGSIVGHSRLLCEDATWVSSIFTLNGLSINSIGGSATLNPVSIPYTTSSNGSINSVQAALDVLFYTPMIISSFSNNVNTIEIGSTVTSVQLNWTRNKTPATLSLNQGIGSLTPSLLTYTHFNSFTTDRTYTLSADDGTTNNGHATSANTSIHFSHKRYWGTSSNSSLNDAQIIALNKEFSDVRSKSFTIDGNGQYIYYCYPQNYGAASFIVNNLPNTAWTLSVQNFTNASGNITSFYVYRTNTIQFGSQLSITIQ